MTKHFILSVLISFLFFACQERYNDKIIGTWTFILKKKDGVELKRENYDTVQIKFLDNYEMLHLTNGNRSGVGLYSYKIHGDSIYRTIIQIDSLGKRDSSFLDSSKFFISRDTMSIKNDEGTFYFKRAIE